MPATKKKSSKKVAKKKATKKAAKKMPTKRAAKKKKSSQKVAKKVAKKKATKQMPIPGTARKKDEDLAPLAEALYDAQMRRIEAGKEEQGLRARLVAKMKAKSMETYIDTDLDLRVIFKPGKDSVSVKRDKAED